MSPSSREETPQRGTVVVDEERFVKMKIRLFWAIIVATVVGTFYFAAVMYKLESFQSRFDTTDQKINYLFRKMKIDNPYTGDLNENSHSTLSNTGPTGP